MKTPVQILQHPHYANKIESQFGMTVTDIKEAMEEYLQGHKPETDRLRSLLFNAFIKSCLDAGNYTLPRLKLKDKAVMLDAFQYWIDTIQDYNIEVPNIIVTTP